MARRMSARLRATNIFIMTSLLALSAGVPEAKARPSGRSERVDRSSSGRGSEHMDPAGAGSASLSGNGRFVAFDHMSNGLVESDRNLMSDVFVRDIHTGKTELVSKGMHGTPALGTGVMVAPGAPVTSTQLNDPHLFLSFDPSISEDGRFVAFTSVASNLALGDSNAAADVFLYDRRTDTTSLVSRSREGRAATGASFLPSISDNGRFVSFTSEASDLVSGDTNGLPDVFVYDRVANRTRRVSLTAANRESAGSSKTPSSSISGNGRFVAFDSDAADLVPPDGNGVMDVFVRDLRRRRTTRVSVAPDGSAAIAPPGCSGSSLSGWRSEPPVGRAISDDGRRIAFTSDAVNLVPNDGNTYAPKALFCRSGLDVFVHDREAHRTERVSLEPDGSEPRGGGPEFIEASISGNGEWVAFRHFCAGCPHDSVYVDAPRPDGSSALALSAVADLRTGEVHVSRVPRDSKSMFWSPFDEFLDLDRTGRWHTVRVTFTRVRRAGPVEERVNGSAFLRRDIGPRIGSFLQALAHGEGEGASGVLRARVALRPNLRDVYLQLDLPPALPAPRGYELSFRTPAARFVLRTSLDPSVSDGHAVLDILRCGRAQGCVSKGRVEANYGTRGHSIVAGVPLHRFGTPAPRSLGDLTVSARDHRDVASTAAEPDDRAVDALESWNGWR